MHRNPFHRRDYQTKFLQMTSYVDFSSPHSMKAPGFQCFGYSDLCVVPGGEINFEGFVASRWTLEYIQEGKGKLCCGNVSNQIGAGSVILRNPHIESGKATMTPVKGSKLMKRGIMIAREPVLEYLCGLSTTPAVEIVRLRDCQRFETFLDQIRNLVKTGHPCIHDELSILIYACLQTVNKHRILHDQMDNFSRVVYTLANSPQHYKNIDMIAREFQLTKSALFRLFKQRFNTTPMNFIIKHRIENSCWYLANHSSPISTVARTCGYDNPAFFSRTFKKLIGKSPSRYRHENSPEPMPLETDLKRD